MESPFLGPAIKAFPLYFEGSFGWWFGTFLFSPIVGMIQSDEYFSGGWNHQLVMRVFVFWVKAWEVISQPGTARNWVLNHDKSMISTLMWPPWLVKQRPGGHGAREPGRDQSSRAFAHRPRPWVLEPGSQGTREEFRTEISGMKMFKNNRLLCIL